MAGPDERTCTQAAGYACRRRSLKHRRMWPATRLTLCYAAARRRRSRRAVSRVALEEQRLARDGGDHRRLERLRDQECRLRALAGEEALGIGRDEHDRHLEGAQQLVDR